jgi:hypothetical protein
VRHVAHGREPRTLVRYRERTPDADWDGFDHKADVLAALLRLQGNLCCYCSRAITPVRISVIMNTWIGASRTPESEHHDRVQG